MARKEMHFFGTDLRFSRQFYRRDTRAYLAEFNAANGHRCAGEASVWYLFSERAAGEIKAFSPDAKIIIMLRSPAEMLHSLYDQFRFDGNEHLPTFRDALAAEDDRRAGRRLGRQSYFPQGLIYRETAWYARQVERYLRVFGPDRVHVILHDDFAADSAAVYRRTLEFLGLAPFPLQKRPEVINGNKQIKNPVLRAICNDPVVRLPLLALRPCVPGAFFAALRSVDARLRKLNSVPAVREPLAPDLRRRLNQEFTPEVRRLSALLGRDLTSWLGDARHNQDVPVPVTAPEPVAAFEISPEGEAVAA